MYVTETSSYQRQPYQFQSTKTQPCEQVARSLAPPPYDMACGRRSKNRRRIAETSSYQRQQYQCQPTNSVTQPCERVPRSLSPSPYGMFACGRQSTTILQKKHTLETSDPFQFESDSQNSCSPFKVVQNSSGNRNKQRFQEYQSSEGVILNHHQQQHQQQKQQQQQQQQRQLRENDNDAVNIQDFRITAPLLFRAKTRQWRPPRDSLLNIMRSIHLMDETTNKRKHIKGFLDDAIRDGCSLIPSFPRESNLTMSSDLNHPKKDSMDVAGATRSENMVKSIHEGDHHLHGQSLYSGGTCLYDMQINSACGSGDLSAPLYSHKPSVNVTDTSPWSTMPIFKDQQQWAHTPVMNGPTQPPCSASGTYLDSPLSSALYRIRNYTATPKNVLIE